MTTSDLVATSPSGSGGLADLFEDRDVVGHVVRAFAFREEDKQRLISTLAASYLLAKARSYQQAIERTQHVVQLRNPWQPGRGDALHARAWATSQGRSIVNTYETLLRNQAEQALQHEHEAIGDVIDKIKRVTRAVGNWVKDFIPWKSLQIARQTWGTGTSDGTALWVNDIQGGDIIGETSMLRVRVVPGESSSDFCKEYAGNAYTMEEASAGDFPDFPAHVGCIHRTEIVVVGDEEGSGS